MTFSPLYGGFFVGVVYGVRMFLNLYRVESTRFWHDIASEGFDEETGVYYPGSGEDQETFYVWGLSKDWVRCQYEGGYSSRKDSDFTEIHAIDRVSQLPDGADLRGYATNTFRDWYNQLKFSAPDWTAPILRPRYFWGLGPWDVLGRNLRKAGILAR